MIMADSSHPHEETAFSEQPSVATSNDATNPLPATDGIDESEQAATDVLPVPSGPMTETTAPFVGRWNRLTSTTNWEKGRIICQWREALMEEGAPVTDYSDEAWTQIVGHITSQHVGRLRRVNQRFGEIIDQFKGLFWSHFQAALDWEDAEMWLEGAIQNDWSVSQMRGKRWETHGTPDNQQQTELEARNTEQTQLDQQSQIAPPSNADQSTPSSHTDQSDSAHSDASPSAAEEGETKAGKADESDQTIDLTARKTARLDVALEDLPDDIADAFEQFKLAIIAQRREGWREITAASVVECLEALKVLALATG